jgi:type VI secretion system secreted protein VgrG
MFDSFALTQANRLLALTFAPGSGIEENTLLPYELSGREGISSGFTYTLSCLSADAFLELKDLIGLPAQIAILTDDGAQRALCGIVTAARSAGSNGGFSRYVLTLQDPFAVLTRRINSRVFQDLSVREFTAILLQEHQQENAVLAQCFDLQDQCRGEHPQQSWVTQFNKSDTVFLQRWFAQEGIAWYFAHGDAGTPSEHPRLTLILCDDASVLPQATATKVRFHRDDGTENEDVVTNWHGTRTLQPGSVMRSSYEYKAVVVNTQQNENTVDQGEFGAQLAQTLEDNHFDTHHSANDEDDYARYGKLRMQAQQYAAKYFTGEGTHRELAVGHHFELTQHPVHDHDGPEQRQFAITRLSLYARNNLPQQLQQSPAALLQPASATNDIWLAAPKDSTPLEPAYRTQFDAVRKGIPIKPAFTGTEHAKPNAPHSMTAVVVGPPGEEIHVNALGCVKVRMGFTRPQEHEHAEGAGATIHVGHWSERHAPGTLAPAEA